MKIDLQRLVDCVSKLEETYNTKLGVKYNRGTDFDDGFKHALKYLRRYVIPCLEIENTAKEISELEELKNELENLELIIDSLQKQIDDINED